jgi:hypothetical protein
MTAKTSARAAVPLAIAAGCLLGILSQIGVAQVAAQDGPPRGVTSDNSPPSSGVESAKGLASGNVRSPLSATQCARIREKVARAPTLKSTFAAQLAWCDAHPVADAAPPPKEASKPTKATGVESQDLPERVK